MDNTTLINDYIEDQTFVNTIFDQTYINALLYKDNATNIIQNISFNNNTIVIKPKQNNIKKHTFAQFIISYLQSQYPMKIISYDSANNKIIISTPTISAITTPSTITTASLENFATEPDLIIVTDDKTIADNLQGTIQPDGITASSITESGITASSITESGITASSIITSDEQTSTNMTEETTRMIQYIILFMILLLFVFILLPYLKK
jgi:hypothetical protein